MKTTNRFQAGGTAAIDEVSMTIASYLERQCALHGIRRGRIPSLLGYANSSKALRRYDAFVGGDYHDATMVERLRACPAFSGEEFEQALATSIAEQQRDREERARSDDLRRRAAFVPHILVEHERTRPEHPLFMIALLGIDHFKRIDLPTEVRREKDIHTFLGQCREHIAGVMQEGTTSQVVRGPFGRPVAFVCRFTYDLSFVFELATGSFTDVRYQAPFRPHAEVSINNKPFPKGLLS